MARRLKTRFLIKIRWHSNNRRSSIRMSSDKNQPLRSMAEARVPDERDVDNQDPDALEEAFYLMTQGLTSLLQASRRMPYIFLRKKRRILESIQEMRGVMEWHIKGQDVMYPNLKLEFHERLQILEKRVEAMESQMPASFKKKPVEAMESQMPASFKKMPAEDAGDQEMLEQLMDRMEKLEISVNRALKDVFPRVESLVSQLEGHSRPGVPPAATSISSISHASADSSLAAADSSSSSSCHPLSSSATPVLPLTAQASSLQMKTDNEGQGALQRNLCRAIAKERLEEVWRYLDAGADVNVSDGGWTPLHWAARTSNPDIISTLLAEGADVHAKDTDGNTPLHLAAFYDDRGYCIYMLLLKGAHVDCRNNNEETPLCLAAKCSASARVMRLLRAANAGESLDVFDE